MIKIKCNTKMFDWQCDCFNQMWSNQDKMQIIKARRQTGKSIMMELYVLKFAVEHKRSIIYYLSVTFKQCSKVFNELRQAVEGAPFIKKINNGTLVIEFTNGSVINFISSEQDEAHLQGNTAHLLIVDEAAFIPDDIFYTVLPYTNATHGQVICCSTPQWKAGFFWDLWCDGLDDEEPEVMTFDFCNYDTKALLSDKRLEYYRKRLPKIKFTQHYLGCFVEASGGVFGEFGKCIGVPTAEDYKREVAIGVDWSTGSGADETVFTAITYDNVVLEIKHFSDKDAVTTIDELLKFSDKFNTRKILVEQNSIGNVFFDMLKNKSKKTGRQTIIEKFNTSNSSKAEIIDNLQVLFQNGQIVLPNEETLINQLSVYERVISKTGKPIYNAPAGLHDDCVMSLCIAAWAVKKNKKKTSFL